MRKLALALACASILGTSNAQAMGLGEMAVRSYLNQPLLAEIPLVDLSANDLEGIRVRLANAQAFERQGFSLSAVSGRIQVQLQGGKQPRVVLTSRSPVHDPVLGVVLELEGPDGLIQRGYDILLDPVSYRAPQQPVLPPVSGRRAVSGAPVPDVTLQGGVEDGRYRVRGGDTLWRIAYNLRPKGVSTEQMMAALREANPKAFVDPGRNETLLSGAVLRVPETDEILRARVRKASAPAEAAVPAVRTGEAAAEPKVAIVAPAQPVVPVVAAPVVGEVVSPPVTASEPAGVAGGEPVPMQEQLEAAKVEKEQLLERLEAVEGQMEKMEELLRLKDEQIKQLEQLLQAAAPGSEKTAPVEVKESQQPVAAPSQPEEKGGLLAALTHPVTLGAGGVGALLLALLIGRLRRRREEALAQAAPVVQPEAPAPVAEVVPMAAVAGAAVGGAVAASLGGEEAPGAAIDPVQSALEEVDVMQAYGLHDRAREVLDEAIERMPEADVLQARRIRLFHEMGAQDEFLRAAKEYRATHPAEDDPHWAAIQAIGAAAYADAPLFGGSGVVQPETSGELAATTANEAQAEAAPKLHPPFVLPEAVTEVEPAAVIQAGEVALELPMASESVETPPAEIGAPEQPAQEEASIEPLSLELPALELGETRGTEAPRAVEPEPLPVFDLQALSLEPAVAEVPSPAPVAGETPVLPEVASPEVPPMPAAEAPVMAEMAAEGAISEDDLMLLGLDAASIEAQPLDLPSLPASEEPQAVLPLPAEALAAPTGDASATPVAMPAASFDERAVKLDMAQALVDLGDLDGARGMLEEIISTRDDELSERAREMLERTAD
ncbi:MAG: FimV/HubP family polar landmark protein [Pseudomonadota bacterium]